MTCLISPPGLHIWPPAITPPGASSRLSRTSCIHRGVKVVYSFLFFLDLLFISSKYLVKNNVIQTTLLQIIFSRPIFNCTACTVPPAQSSAAGGINGLSESEIVHGPGFGIPLVPSVPGLAPPSGQAFFSHPSLSN